MIKRSKHGMAHVYSFAERNKHRLTFSCEEGRDRIPDAGSGSTSISDRSRGIPAHLLRGRHGENVHFLQNGRILLTVNGANFMRAEEKADRSPLNQFGAVFLPGEDRKHAQVERGGRFRNG